MFVSALLLLVRAAAATSVCLVLRDGEGCRRGGVCPNAFRPLCWDSSWWYATGVIGCGNVKEGLRREEGKKSHFVLVQTMGNLQKHLQEKSTQMGDSCTWWPQRRGGRKSCWQPSWSGSYWCRPPESWARCGSWSAGRCWHPRLERWTALASCSPSASVWDWGNGTLQRKDTFFHSHLKKNLCGTFNSLNLQHHYYAGLHTTRYE